MYGLTPKRLRNVTLLSGSLIFYALGEPKYLFLLLLSVVVNYFFGLHLEPKGKRRRRNLRRIIFGTALVYNVGVLAIYKYGLAGIGLPPGISFYTFQILSYLTDVYRGELKREDSFLRLAGYITMFPQLLSGPLVGYGKLRKSLRQRDFSVTGVQEGMKIFTMGLASKVLLADRIGLLWQEVQVTGFESISTPLAWIAAVAYSMKIYFDFYGYSLMASGLGRMLGFELPQNFRNPYMAASVRDFYRRWHMSLGRWFTKYVYIPLGGNRRGEFRTVCNLLAVWTLTSVWHGSKANFLIWGMLLWLAIVVERQLKAWGAGRWVKKGPARVLSHLYVWAFIPITWVCFDITDIAQLQIYLGRMFHVFPGQVVGVGDWQKALTDYGGLFAAGAIACTPAVGNLFRKLKDTLPGIVLLAALFWLCIWRLQVEGCNPFKYLDF